MAGWPDERETTLVDGFERDPDREPDRLPARLRCDRVRLEQDRPVKGAEQRQILQGVDASKLLVARVPVD